MRIVSGVQPSGELHLGNYFGAIKQQIALQSEPGAEPFFFIADWHALTTVRDAGRLARSVREAAAAYLALGLDPARAAFFRQSDVPEVHELAWLLATVAGMGALRRQHAFKDKVEKGIDPTVGLFTYPVLMAADICAYGADLVPVGQDQVQHVELAQDLAASFNAAYGRDVLKRPEWRLSEAPKVPGTDGEKMAKSRGNVIPIFAEPAALKKAVMGVKTDSRDFRTEPLDPTSCRVFALWSLFSRDEAERDAMRARYRDDRSFGYADAKKALLAKVEEAFGPARAKYDEWLAPGSALEDVLAVGAARARSAARETLDLAREAAGLGKARRAR